MSRKNRGRVYQDGRLYMHTAPPDVIGPPAWCGWANVNGEQYRVYARYIQDGAGRLCLALQVRERRTLTIKSPPKRADFHPDQGSRQPEQDSKNGSTETG